ncbi:MAG TPA: type II CAAX endopeptidase family protein [Phycisphaerae bacterium]|jgi:membrane protease YdiL (CAAX protease family)|nr:CPBP family intramembrane metalloprotease [Phycisphaerae bacterium]HOB73385.1 type II CAAX endopeptidase family protein [Phycisphaerae bacterium]HOJ54963.1 type II CAAX endopeptidase family protein [Phycisphaerae bacterium]HOL25027.1 type II CAAX endopeptidase family protein [Phycisphaerae bacterium]HPP21328.1 type II CAAX endopeptidase family protein [Phycisphaerae bacterium]
MNLENRSPPEEIRADEASPLPYGPSARQEHEAASFQGTGQECFYVPFARPVSLDEGLPPPVPAGAPAPAQPQMRWWRALLEAFTPLAAGIGGSLLAIPMLMFWQPEDERWFNLLTTATGGLVALVACVALLKWAGQPLHSIGLTGRELVVNAWIGVGSYVLTIICLFILGAFVILLFPEISKHQDDAAKAIEANFPPMGTTGMIALMTFVAIWEEIAFRGFMLTRLQSIFRRWWLTIPIGAVLFGFGHGYQGPLAIVQTMLLGIVMGVLFWWRKSLVPGIVFHLLNNVMAFLMLKS